MKGIVSLAFSLIGCGLGFLGLCAGTQMLGRSAYLFRVRSYGGS